MHMLQQHKCRVIVAIHHSVSEVNPSKIKSNLNSVGKIIASGTAVVDAIFSDPIKLTEREPPRERAPRWRHN